GLRARGGLHLQFLVILLLVLLLPLAFRAFAAELLWRRRDRKGRVRHPHHPIGDGVGLALKRVVDRPDRELRLHLRLVSSACNLTRKQRDFAGIPQDAASYRLDWRILSDALLFLGAFPSVSGRPRIPLRQNPQRCLIPDCALKRQRPLDRLVAESMPPK